MVCDAGMVGRMLRAGEIYELDSEVAKDLVQAGHAEPVAVTPAKRAQTRVKK